MKTIPDNYNDFNQQKEIPREVEVPDLTEDEIREITAVTFAEVNPQKADILFVFGTCDVDWKPVAKLYIDGLVDRVLVTGFLGKSYYETGIPLAHSIADLLVEYGVPKDDILIQNRSANTLEDVIFGKEVLDENKINPKSILFSAKAHACGRAARTLRKYFPLAQLFPFAINGEYDGVFVTREDWWRHEISKARVYGEYLRIKKYSERGDIARNWNL